MELAQINFRLQAFFPSANWCRTVFRWVEVARFSGPGFTYQAEPRRNDRIILGRIYAPICGAGRVMEKYRMWGRRYRGDIQRNICQTEYFIGKLDTGETNLTDCGKFICVLFFDKRRLVFHTKKDKPSQ